MASQVTYVQGKYILGSKSKAGDPRRSWEDRVYVGGIHRKGSEPLVVGIVADGVGSADGARGAELAIVTVKESIENSRGDNILAIIESALELANSALYGENQKNEGNGLTTLAVAVVYNERCFVGNVGDSRVYWVQTNINESGKEGKLLQLTRDHTYYNIYGGDKNGEDAGIVVNAIGKKPKVQVDFGFYLKGDDVEQAYQLGITGLPLKPGDAILLCSDGLIKNDLQGRPYIEPKEIIDAMQTEYMDDLAATKMVSYVEGRQPDDNVSAVTIQYFPRDLVDTIDSRFQRAQKVRNYSRIAFALAGLFAIGLIGLLGYKLSQRPATEYVYLTSLPAPTLTPTQPIPPGKARVDQVRGTGSNIMVGQSLDTGSNIFGGTDGIQIVVGEQSGTAGVMYWFGGSAARIEFDSTTMRPVLEKGAVYIQPGTGSAEVHFSQWKDIIASVAGSRMIVELKGPEIWVYCFEGKCRLDPGAGKDELKIDVGNKRVYQTALRRAEDQVVMTYKEMWSWNTNCNFCMFGLQIVPTPTLQPQSQPDPVKPKPKPKPKPYGAGFAWSDRFEAMELQREELAVRSQLPLSILFTFSMIILAVSPKVLFKTFNSTLLAMLAVVASIIR